ncbi:tyrosine-type recombinase/integrase [Candidatus Borrarchaeum sp.]|uniref:tyrosine-type recombinase/integrase n=1 Tax=Candidatus Borrarchaeum sp. TaxID=2846742 RepID=UPI002580FC78|nr:tyrosine-type recombinase/integrase [Candidatus Borrarchaeum sp.]
MLRNKQKPRKFGWLLKNKQVVEWIQRFKSEGTQRTYLNRFADFCKLTDITPEVLLNNTPQENDALLEQGYKKLIEHNLAHRINMTQSAINSFLRFYDKKLEKPASERHDEFGHYISLSEREKNFGWLLDYDEIRYWIDDYTAENTRRNYLRRLHHFLKEHKLTPPELLALSEKEIIKKYTFSKQRLLHEDKSSSANKLRVTLATFFDAHRKLVRWTKKERVNVKYTRVQNQYIPSKDEIYRLADSSGSLRNRAIILCLYHSAVRKNCIRRWTYGMVKDYLYPKLQVPIRIKITPEIDTKLQRYGIAYFYAFLQDEAAEALKTYIEYRKETEPWDPEDNDPIFVSENYQYLYTNEKPPKISMSAIYAVIKRTAKNCGLPVDRIWTHLIRKATRKVLYKAPIDNDMAEAIMGHKLKGSKENYFDRHDLDWIANEYMKAPFSREGVGRLNHLEKEKQKLEAKITTQQEELETLQRQLKAKDQDTENIKTLLTQLTQRINDIEAKEKKNDSKQ